MRGKESNFLLWWFVGPFFLWAKSKLTTTKLKEELALDEKSPVVYALPTRSLSDLLVLYYHCRNQGLPLPTKSLSDLKGHQGAYLYITKPGLIQRKRGEPYFGQLQKLVEQLEKHENQDIQIVPVSVLWGRDPGKEEKSLFKLLFTDDENAGILQKFFIVLAHGRNNMAYFGRPISLRRLVNEGAPIDQTTRKLRRVLRVHFIKQRSVILGNRLYIREQVVRRIVKSKAVQAVINDEAKRGKESLAKLNRRAQNYAREITADITYSVLKLFDILLTRLWNKIFDGVVIRNLEPVRELAHKDCEIIYVPNHRSHLDYLLINYSIFKGDLPPPHTAAGINLDFWPMGGFLRRGGAFFIRRTFGGNRLYAAVFNEYLHYLIANGYPVAFFPEGGRSRTGRLLPPKTGMLSMVVQSILRGVDRPVALVPVYIGYDWVVEVRTYLKELSGSGKRKESFLQLFNARKVLKRDYGRAYISFGEPVVVNAYLKAQVGWDEKPLMDTKPEWLAASVDALAHDLMVRVNEAALVSPVSLVSMALLSVPQRALPEEELLGYVDKLISLQENLPYDKRVELPKSPFKDHLARIEARGVLQRFQHRGGDVLYLNEYQSFLMAYYKNNVLHLFALPSLVARFFQYNQEVSQSDLVHACEDFYPFLKDEFFLPWSMDDAGKVIGELLEAMVAIGFLSKVGGSGYARPPVASMEHEYLVFLGRALGTEIERYAITVTLLAKQLGNGQAKREDFEQQCQKMSQRLAILNGIHSPEATDRSLFKNQINLLKSMGYLRVEGEDRLVVHDKVSDLATRAAKLLSIDVRNSLERVASGTTHG